MIETKGKYRGKAVHTEFGVSSTGKDFIKIEFEVDYQGTKERMWYRGYFTPAASKYAFAAMRACGWTGDSVEDLSGITDKEVNLSVSIDPEYGAQIDFVNPIGQGGERRSELSPADTRAVQNRINQMLKMEEPADAPWNDQF